MTDQQRVICFNCEGTGVRYYDGEEPRFCDCEEGLNHPQNMPDNHADTGRTPGAVIMALIQRGHYCD